MNVVIGGTEICQMNGSFKISSAPEGLRMADDDVRGRIAVTGSEYLDGANVEARLSGRGVVGKLLSDEGRMLAEFEGRLTAGGAAGTYRDRFGGSGEWEVEQ